MLLAFDQQQLFEKYFPANHSISPNNDQKYIDSNRNLQTSSLVYINPPLNYLKNYDFSSRPWCFTSICRYQNTSYKDQVPYWYPNPTIEIGLVGFFDFQLIGKPVVELSCDFPTCIYQNALNLPYGLYRVNISYKTNYSITLEQNKFSLKIDNISVAIITPPNHNFNYFTYDTIILQNNSNKRIQLCGQGSQFKTDAVFILQVKLLRIGYYKTTIIQNQTSSQNQTFTSNQASSQNQTFTSNQASSQNYTFTSNQASSQNHTQSQNQNQNQTSSQNENQSQFSQNEYNFQNNIFPHQNSNLAQIMMQDYKFYQYFMINKYEIQGPLQLFILSTITSSQVSVFSKIPGLRQIFSRTFGFLVNFDHMWLYAYQHRKYGPLLRSIFDSILNFENNKWNFLSDGIYINRFHINVDQIKRKIDHKPFYQQIVHIILRGNGNSFFVNTVEFFIMNLPIILFMFLLGKFINYLNKNYFKLSIFNHFLKQFQFNLLIFLMLLQGNFELFSYYFASDLFTFFYFNKLMKIHNILLIKLYFLFIMITLGGCFIAKWLYEGNTFLSLQNNKLQKCTLFYIETTLFNFILGTVHLSTYKLIPYQIQILTCIEICYMIILIQISLKNNYKFYTKNKLWTTVFSSFLRIILNVTHKGFSMISNQREARMVDDIYSVLIILYFLNCIVIILVQVGFLSFKIIKFIFNYRTKLIKSNFQRKPRIKNFNMKKQLIQNKITKKKIIQKLKIKEEITTNIEKNINNKPQKVVLQIKNKLIKMKYRKNHSNSKDNIKKKNHRNQKKIKLQFIQNNQNQNQKNCDYQDQIDLQQKTNNFSQFLQKAKKVKSSSGLRK